MTDTVTLHVVYEGAPGTRFDRDWYLERHMPLVLEHWGPLGLVAGHALFPAVADGGLLALTVMTFRDDVAFAAALASPATATIMADVARFTDATPAIVRAVPL